MISELSQKGFKRDSEMIDLSRHQSLGSALREAVDKFAGETCLIEADRERENHRLTYREFKEAATPMAKFLQDRGFKAGSRAAIIMTNQSCWLIAAYAVFYAGGVLVPLDYKLSAPEHWPCSRTRRPKSSSPNTICGSRSRNRKASRISTPGP